MASVGKCLSERGISETKLTQSLRALSIARAAESPNKGVLMKGITQAEQLYEVLVEKHVVYVQKLGATRESVDHQNWINNKSDVYNTEVEAARDAVNLLDVGDGEGGEPIRNATQVKEEL